MSEYMNKTRIKFKAQDAILDAIVKAAEQHGESQVRKLMREEGARLAQRWGVQHEGLPDTRRKAE